MKRIRYQVAMSLDAFIAGPDGSYDWIPQDPDIDFAAHFAQFDTALMGRRTYDVMAQAGHLAMLRDMRTFVVSNTLTQQDVDQPGVTVLGKGWEEAVQSLRAGSGKDIWLFGGGKLFKSLLAAKLVDTLEVAVVPVLLGGGIPLAPPPFDTERLVLAKQRVYSRSGIVALEYGVVRSAE